MTITYLLVKCIDALDLPFNIAQETEALTNAFTNREMEGIATMFPTHF